MTAECHRGAAISTRQVAEQFGIHRSTLVRNAPLSVQNRTDLPDTLSWQSAAQKLSDGAFKLFVYLSLGAERSTGRFVFRQGYLAKALNKSRRSIGKYLRELEEKQLCRISGSANQHATATLQIRDD